jgi:hypothetical protein
MAKAAKMRNCPVVGGLITRAACGENRQSRHACPADCQHNPFTVDNYSQLLEIEDWTDELSMQRLATESGSAFDLAAKLQNLHARNKLHDIHQLVVWRQFYDRDAGGRTFAERWQEAGYPGLNNDMRVLYAAKSAMRPCLLEILEIQDAERVLVVDLLDGNCAPKLLVDRSMAAVAVRFMVFFGWCYELPHFLRTSGTGTPTPDFGAVDGLAGLLEIVRHLGGPTTAGEARRRWLAEHFVRVTDAFLAIARERQRRMLLNSDMQRTSALYEAVGKESDMIERLLSADDVEEDQPSAEDMRAGYTRSWVWLEGGAGGSRMLPGQTVIGEVLQGLDFWCIKAMPRERYERLRDLFESRLAGLVRFRQELRENIGMAKAGEIPPADAGLVPPRLLENISQLELSTALLQPAGAEPVVLPEGGHLIMEMTRRWLDEAVPALGGRTPRAAAKDPELRPKVISLVKDHVKSTDERNLRTGRRDDINWLIRALDLPEIDHPPPPPRARPESDAFDDEPDEPDMVAWEDEDDTDFAADTDATMLASLFSAGRASDHLRRPLTPPLTGNPFSTRTAELRMKQAMDQFESGIEGLRELRDSAGPDLCDALLEMLEESMEDEVSSTLFAVSLLPVWFSMVKRGCRVPEIDIAGMVRSHNRLCKDMNAAAERGGVEGFLAAITDGCHQPALLELAMHTMYRQFRNLHGNKEPDTADHLVAFAVSRVLIDAVDRALRGG